MAIQTSSCIRVSNIFNASSISILPNSFLKYISDQIWEWSSVKYTLKKELTCSHSFRLLRRDGENREYLSHDLHKYLRHFSGQRNPSINPKALEEALDALKDFDKRIVASALIFCRLCDVGVQWGPRKAAAKMQTERRTPIQAKMAPAGGTPAQKC